MKDILIVISPTSEKHRDICKRMKMEAEELEGKARQVLESAFLVTGPKSFEIATRLYCIAVESKLPVAIFEIESVLSFPDRLSQKNL
jgi:hypothetical protein